MSQSMTFRRMVNDRFELEAGPLLITYPLPMSEDDKVLFAEFMELFISKVKRINLKTEAEGNANAPTP
jgi:hypothetical protein